MRLNYDCIRDVLLFIEENLPLNSTITLEKININYNSNDIAYSILKLNEAGYINAHIVKANGLQILTAIIFDITFIGHQFLDTIRPKDVWEQSKEISSKIGIKTLDGLTKIASQLITKIITNQIGF